MLTLLEPDTDQKSKSFNCFIDSHGDGVNLVNVFAPWCLIPASIIACCVDLSWLRISSTFTVERLL